MTTPRMTKVYPIVLAGGSGTRLWPLSRSGQPKQFLPLFPGPNLLDQTINRVSDRRSFQPPLVVCNAGHADTIRAQLGEPGGGHYDLLIEPTARDTAPAIAAAALLVEALEPEALVLVLPSDHVIRDTARFAEALAAAVGPARAGAIVTFGIPPRYAETGYGYIGRGDALDGSGLAFAVDRFVEKPPEDVAAQYVANGRYFWNTGMFLFRTDRLLAELATHAPAILAASERAVEGGRREAGGLHLCESGFSAAPRLSFDHAVMEHTRTAAVVPGRFDWNDLGSWSALWDLDNKDRLGNVVIGNAVTGNVSGSYVRSSGPLVAVDEVEDLIVVATDDAVLIVPRDKAQNIKTLVARLESEGRLTPSDSLTPLPKAS